MNRVVPLKNLLTGCLRGVAVTVLIIEGVVNCSYGVPMVIGSYLGGMVSNKTPRRFLRALVIVIGFGVAAYYFWNVYGASIPRIGGRIAGRVPDKSLENIGSPDLELLVFVEVEQKDLAHGVEVVAGAWQDSCL